MQSSISRWQSSLQTHVNNKIWNNIYCICRQTLFQPSLAWRQTKWYKIWISVNHIISHSLIPQHQSSLTQTTLHPSPYKTLSQQPATWFYVIVLRGKTTNSNKLSVGIEWLLHDKMRWYPILFGMTVFKLFNISIKLDHPSFFWDLSIKTQILQRVSLFI